DSRTHCGRRYGRKATADLTGVRPFADINPTVKSGSRNDREPANYRKDQARKRLSAMSQQLPPPVSSAGATLALSKSSKTQEVVSEMIGKVFAGIATAGVLAAVLASGARAAPAATAAANPAKAQRPAAKDVFGGTVTAISATELTVKNAKAGSRSFLRTD